MIILLAAALGTAAPVATSAQAAKCAGTAASDALVCAALQAEKNGDHATAAQSFEEAAQSSSDKDPKTARMWAAAGNLWIAAKQPGKAAADLDKALALPGLEAEQRGEALLDRARAAEAQDDLKTARAKANEAAQTISADPFYWYFSAALAIRENDPNAAQKAIDKALSLAPSDPTILFEAGHVADMMGNDERARSYWTRAAAGDPNGDAGKAAAKAIELLGVTPTVKLDGAQPK
ncbi:MAG: hypothetical protein HOP95_00500 [Sphingomonas sp.]|nr:hypothetical protein [Sphingomonas sp.]